MSKGFDVEVVMRLEPKVIFNNPTNGHYGPKAKNLSHELAQLNTLVCVAFGNRFEGIMFNCYPYNGYIKRTKSKFEIKQHPDNLSVCVTVKDKSQGFGYCLKLTPLTPIAQFYSSNDLEYSLYCAANVLSMPEMTLARMGRQCHIYYKDGLPVRAKLL